LRISQCKLLIAGKWSASAVVVLSGTSMLFAQAPTAGTAIGPQVMCDCTIAGDPSFGNQLHDVINIPEEILIVGLLHLVCIFWSDAQYIH
jgi:hypothetical protein